MLNLIKLENRIVLDGAMAGEALDHAFAYESVVAGNSYVPDHADNETGHIADAAALLSAPAGEEVQAESVEIVLVADSLPDYHKLTAAATPGTRVIVYDAASESVADVIGRITELGQPVDSVSILSHGEAGNFRLGNEVVTADNVDENADAWESLRSVLTDDSHIYVFGCNAGSGEGQSLLDSLSDATGADVWASDDTTGKLGDWDLEVGSEGADEGTPPLDAEQLDDYSGMLVSSYHFPNTIGVDENSSIDYNLHLWNTDGDQNFQVDLVSWTNHTLLQNVKLTNMGYMSSPFTDDDGIERPGYNMWRVEGELADDMTGTANIYVSVGGVAQAEPITINVRPINDAPSIDDQEYRIDENSPAGMNVGIVTATDINGSDPLIEGDTLTFSVVGGSGRTLFDVNAATGQITVAQGAVLDYEAKNEYELEVQVQDNGEGNLTSHGTVTIHLNDLNEPPDIADQNFGIEENSPGGTPVGDIIANDVDGDNLTYTVTGGTGQGVFQVDPQTGEITVAPGAVINYETAPEYTLDIRVQDDGDGNLTDEAVMTITVIDKNEPPNIDPQHFTIEENSPGGTFVGDPVASDPDGDNLTYRVVGGTGQGFFNVDPGTGRITVAQGTDLDYEKTPEYTLDVQVQDDGEGNLTNQATMTITLTDVNDPPEIAPQFFNIKENSPGGTDVGPIEATDPDGDNLTYTVLGGDGMGVFNVNTVTGDITVAEGADLDYETKNEYFLDVQVQDDGLGELTNQAIMTISVIDENDPPDIAPQTFDINENSPAGTNVNPGPVIATDQDGDNLIYRVVDGSGQGIFDLDPVTHQIVVAPGADLDFERTPTYTLEVQVEDDGDGRLTNQATMTININNLNEPPDIAPQNFNVNENSPCDTFVGTVEATDPEGDTITYEVIGGDGQGVFNVNPQTGEITVACPAADLNFETKPEYTLDVRVTDAYGLENQAVMTITLVDLPEGPIVDLNGPGSSGGDGMPDEGVREVDFAATFIENQASGTHITDEDAMVTDPDTENPSTLSIRSLEVTLTNLQDQDELRINDTVPTDAITIPNTNISAVYDPASGVMTLTGEATVGQYSEALRTITFYNTSENPHDIQRVITVVATDIEGNVSNAPTCWLTVIAVNDAPLNHVPGDQVTPEDTPLVFSPGNGNAISVSDIDAYHYDADDNPVHRKVQVTISVNNGTLSEGGGRQAGDQEIIINDTLDRINGRLNGLTYTPESGYVGEATLTITTDDQGAYGSPGYDGPLEAASQISIFVGNPPPHIPPEVPPGPYEGDEGGISRPGLGEGRGLELGFLYDPGEVEEVGNRHDFREGRAMRGGREELYKCCTLEEALRIGCRFAPALDPEARLSNITWGWMKSEGWEAPLLDEEFNLYSSNPEQRHFLREAGDVGFSVKPGEFAWTFFGEAKEEIPANLLKTDFVKGSEDEFNAAPGELKHSFFAGREGYAVPASWGSDAWPLLGNVVPCEEDGSYEIPAESEVTPPELESRSSEMIEEDIPADEILGGVEDIPEKASMGGNTPGNLSALDQVIMSLGEARKK
ncbi:MAG: hypothetical protein DRI57_00710 [Deltaproteobacteria bacterium]|nr:MAG: hypothetical protein DRI57_00710 [Deltaproteobacteria bacterium]